MRNTIYRIAFACLASLVIFACQQVTPVQFEVDTENITIGPEGGVKIVKIKSADRWIATVQEPWLTISPANGVGSVDCRVIVDSALAVNQREATIRINNQATDERMDFKVVQNGFDYQIVLSEPEVNIASYASLEEREFDVKVKSNVPFDVELPEGADSWLSYTLPELVLDRGVRPREVAVHFKWGVNFNPTSRDAVIKFNPKDSQVTPAIKNDLKINQEAAEEIEIGVKGDSLALIAINRALGCWTEFETSERLEFWDGVKVWESGENKGRVRSAEFFMFGTKEGIPFQVKYLTAAEELYFFSNTNTFLLSLDPGEHICELTQLKKLTIGAYGLTTLPDSFKNLSNLEYLDLSSNNFQTVPEVLTPENFPNLTALILNACQRHTIADLSNTTKTNFGGLFEESDVDADGNKSFPKRLLKWSKLDTLRLSVNYLEGTLPDLENDPDFPKWTAEEVNACDTLPEILIGKPKVLPDTDLFAINLNRLYGTAPDWLLYHPKLDLWYPFSLVFFQEGKASNGTRAGFDNEPANLDYYYEHYVNKQWNPANTNVE
jgi:hypothetical protein